VKLADFGLARVEGVEGALTRTGEMVGTAAYMSPEQARSEPVDARTDVYSLGASLYELLTLRPPVQGDDLAEVVSQVLTADPPPPRRLDRRIPRDLETVVLKALEKDRERRYRTAADFASDLRWFADGSPVRARRIGWLESAWRRVRRRPLLTTAVVLAAAVAALATVLLARSASDRATERARRYEELLLRHQHQIHDALDVTAFGDPDPTRWVGAVATLDEAIRLAPDRPAAYLARSLIGWLPVEDRLADADRLRSLGLSPRSVHSLRAAILSEAGREEESEAERAASEVLPEDADTPWVVHHVWGRTLLRQGKFEEAISRLTLALARMPPGDLHRTQVYLWRSVAKQRLQDVAGAIEDVSRIQAEGAFPWTGRKVYLARLWRLLGQTERVDRLLEEALEETRARGSLDSWRDLASAAANARDWPFAARVNRTALASHPGDPTLSGRLVQALYQSRRDREAVETADGAAPAARADRILRRYRAGALVRLGRGTEALSELDGLEEWGDEAMTLKALGRPKEALEAARKYAANLPHSATAHLYLGRILRGLKRHGEAAEAFGRSLSLDPWSPHAMSGLAGSLCALGRAEEGLVEAERSVSLDPTHADGWHMKAVCLENLSRYRESVDAYDRALRCDLEDPGSIEKQRAGMLQVLGRDEEAIEAFDRVPPEADPVAALLRAQSLVRVGRWRDALAAADAEERIDRGPAPESRAVDWMRLRVAALHAAGDLEGALRFVGDAWDRPDAYRGDPPLPGAPGSRMAMALADERNQVLVSLGRFDEALRSIEEAAPRLPQHRASLAGLRIGVLVNAGRFAEAIVEQAQRPSDAALCEILDRAGRSGEAREVARRVLADPQRRSPWMLALAGEHEAARAARVYEWFPETRWEALTRAETHARLGETDDAIHWLSRAAEWGLRVSAKAAPYPVFHPIRDDPRFASVWRRIERP
jgi:tetratricopeptide (TPR) repeat protein